MLSVRATLSLILLALVGFAADARADTPAEAVASGDVAALRALLDAGTDVDLRDDDRRTLLHLAATHGNKDVALLLLERGADAGAATDSGATPLHKAVQGGRMDGFGNSSADADYPALVRLLLDHGADPNAPSSYGTPLAEAVKHSLALVNLLVERGGNPTSTRRWKTPFGEEGLKPVHRAAAAGAVDVLARFLDLGVLPDEEDRGHTLLELAAWAGQEGTVRLLLRRGSSIERAGAATMLAAASSGDVGTLKLLQDHGGNLHAEVDGNTLLHAAASIYTGGRWMVRYLISEGLDANARNEQGLTPLEFAERCGAHDTPGALRWYSGAGRYEWAYLLAIALLSAGLGAVLAKRKGYAGILGAVLGVTLLGLIVLAALPRRRALPKDEPSLDPDRA